MSETDHPGWAGHLKHPLVLVGFIMFLLSGYLKFFSENESTDPRIVAGYTVFLVLSVMIVIAGLALSFKREKRRMPSKHGL